MDSILDIYLFNKLLGIFGSSQINKGHATVPAVATKAPKEAKMLANNFKVIPPFLSFSCLLRNVTLIIIVW